MYSHYFLVNNHRQGPDFGVAEAMVQNPTIQAQTVWSNMGGPLALAVASKPLPVGVSYADMQVMAAQLGPKVFKEQWPVYPPVSMRW
jgi:hypothetical protein